MSQVKVKVCGITTVADARVALNAGAEMLGFNFYPRSARFIGTADARKIIEALRHEIGSANAVKMVGVFVNQPSPDDLLAIVRDAKLDAAQLHGDESSEFCADLKTQWRQGFLIKALRVDDDFQVEDALKYQVDAIMLDAFHADLRGGTGQTIDWSLARRTRELVPRLILAGGLSPENVQLAIREVQPYAVDACSSLESSPGIKDIDRLKAFVSAALNS